MSTTILWFRRDLRLADNPALQWAIERGGPILPIYLHSPEDEAPWAPGAASRWWLHHSLTRLSEALARRGLTLHCLRGSPRELLPRLTALSGATAVTWNRRYEPHIAALDREIEGSLAGAGLDVHRPHSGTLFPPGTILNVQGGPYRLFTPFWRAARQRIETIDLTPVGAMDQKDRSLPGARVDGWGDVEGLQLLDSHPWHTKLHHHWQPGEAGAEQRLAAFIAGAVGDYDRGRDLPATAGTSRLSPHLHFGEIPLHRILLALQPLLAGVGGPGAMRSAERFLAELGWREFARHVLHHFPHTDREPMDQRFRAGFWGCDGAALQAWQRGETGIALVDAGMRELWQTGWMHNRVRMVAASLLTKNLGCHWLQGARWFWDTLVDADLANNSLGWQWVAGCGVDAAPYFRIFNPDTQARRFDPESAYIRHWLHDRPSRGPIVDLAASRRDALDRYRTRATDLPPP